MVALEALCKSNASWALSDLVEALDDVEFANRMFAQRHLEKMLDVSLADFGYRFYMTPSERREPLTKIRGKLLKTVEEPASDSDAVEP